MKLNLKARIRLAKIKEKSNDRNTFKNSIYKALHTKGLTDLEISMLLKELSDRHANEVLQKKQRLEREFLEVEKADDFTRLNLI